MGAAKKVVQLERKAKTKKANLIEIVKETPKETPEEVAFNEYAELAQTLTRQKSMTHDEVEAVLQSKAEPVEVDTRTTFAAPAEEPAAEAVAAPLPPRRDMSKMALFGSLAAVILQALLGMWTVTWLLKPIVVMAHLLGGLLTFSLLAWMAWRASNLPIHLADVRRMRWWLGIGAALLVVQIALGGWVSSNYAALACATDFPTCVGQWWPPHDFAEGFRLWRGIGVDYEGGVLDGDARIAIQMAHRVMAGVVSV